MFVSLLDGQRGKYPLLPRYSKVSRNAILKPVTMPRLELTAALVASKMGGVLLKELEFDQIKETYWTDSKPVVGYINNDARRFHVFVSNRVQEIRERH